MKNIKHNTLLLSGLLILSISIKAQTVNIGELYISPFTQISSLGALDNKATGDLVNDGEFYTYSDYNNDGLVTFSTGTTTGLNVLKGLFGNQKISGIMPIHWYSVEFDNGIKQPAFLLSNDIDVNGTVNFNKGIIDNKTSDGTFIFENKSNFINVSDISYVNGPVQKNGDEVFIYPIGDKNKYRFAQISAPEQIISSLRCAYINENSNLQYPHSNKSETIGVINNQEYWLLDQSSGTSNIILTLSWDENSTTPSGIIMPPIDAIHIVRWDSAKAIWVDEGGIADSTNKTVTTPVKVSGYGIFTTARIEENNPSVPCNSLIIYNLISSNGDGLNDFLKIDGLTECSAENTVEIFNRWGVKVFETANYGSNDNVFKGYSNARTTISANEFLPSGTYFYVLDIKYKSKDNFQNIKKSGYLFLTH